jgi:hypothetical protein
MKHLTCLFAVTTVVLLGCGVPKRQEPEGNKKVERLSEAASLHTSVTSITPWDDIKEALKPNFKLEANDALARSIPTTLVRLDRVMDIMRSQLGISPAIVKETSTTTTTTAVSGQPASSATQGKVERLAPEIPSSSSSAPLAATAATLLTAPDSSVDAMLQYQTAANLLRDIAVLNTEIENVARRTGTEPYLVRIRVGIMGLRPKLGYTTFANVSMFGTTDTYDEGTGQLRLSGDRPRAPLVIPILSTDAVQATRRVNSAVARREVALALNLLKGFGAIGAGTSRAGEREEEAAGAELESVVTVGRLTDNTLRIRMGADPVPGGGYEMVTRTFSVSAVVFLPKTARQLQYVSRLSMHDVESGDELDAAYGDAYKAGLSQISRDYDREFQLGDRLTRLDDHVLHGNYDAFERELISDAKWSATPTDSQKQELRRKAMYVWSQLTALLRYSRYGIGTVTLPRLPEQKCPELAQVVAYQAGDKTVQVTLAHGQNLRAKHLEANLMLQARCRAPAEAAAPEKQVAAAIKGAAKTPKAGVVILTARPILDACKALESDTGSLFAWAPSSLDVTKDGRLLTATFPQIDKVALLDGGRDLHLVPYSIDVKCRAEAGFSRYKFIATVPAETEKKSEHTETPDLLPDTSIVAVERGKGEISFSVIGAGKENLHVVVRNADVSAFADDAGKSVSRKRTAWAVADGGRYVVRATSMTERLPVRLELISIAADNKRSPLRTVEIAVDEKRK